MKICKPITQILLV